MDFVIERAMSDDYEAIVRLLEACGLSSHGVLGPDTVYWVCRSDNDLVGICGLELGAACGLLRSVCVMQSKRATGIAERLVNVALAEATRLGLEDVYLFSKDTGEYFERLGWSQVPVAEVATRLPAAPQVRRYQEIGWYSDERAFRRSTKI